MDKLRVGVIGIGTLGSIHARIYSEMENVELVAVCDLDASRKEQAAELGVEFVFSPQDLLGRVDAVSVAVPTSGHYEVSKLFLQKGVHVLVEKPMTSTAEQAEELTNLALEHSCVLRVGHVERYNAAFKKVRSQLRRVRFIEIHRLGPFTPRINDCGVVLDLMIHDLDIVLGLIDSEIESVDAVGIRVLTRFEDIANVRLRFKNGCIANLTASRLTPEKQRKIRIFQDNAYISLDYGNQSAQIYTKAGFSIKQEKIDIPKEESLRNELDDFIESITSGSGIGNPDLKAKEALGLALKIIDEINRYYKAELEAARTS